MDTANTFTWFSNEPIPEFVKIPYIVIGGTRLLTEYFNLYQRASFNNSELWICSPFIQNEIEHFLPHLEDLNHNKTSLSIITSNIEASREAQMMLGQYPWANFLCGINPKFHAKIYLGIGEGKTKVCLLGSHNFTRAGISQNFEAGTLFYSLGKDQVSKVIYDLHSDLEQQFKLCGNTFNLLDSQFLDSETLISHSSNFEKQELIKSLNFND